MIGVSDAEKAKAAEEFKKIVKAYEVLSNAISRQAYDIENHINEETVMDSRMYEDTTSLRNHFQPRTQKDFYNTKWTNYQKPKWYHPYNGFNVRDEYIYRKKDTDRAFAVAPHVDIILDWSDAHRLWLYLAAFAVFNIYDLYKNIYLDWKQERMELQLLQDSF